MANGLTHEWRSAYVQLRKRASRPAVRHRLIAAGLGLLGALTCQQAAAQQASQPGYDPIQTERRFERQQSDQAPAGRPQLPKPQFAGPAGQGDAKPMFVLRRVSITGATAIPHGRLATAYQPY